GRHEPAAALAERAVAAAPDDRDVVYWASELVATRARAIELLERYLELSRGDRAERIDGARGTLNEFRVLGDRAVWTWAERPERVELPLTLLWDPPTARRLGYVVQARAGMGDKPVPLLLDTGSPGLTVLERVARKRGFVELAEKTAFGGGGEGRHATRRGVFPQFALGGLRFTDALSTTTREELEPTGRYHGLIGLSAFDGYRVTLDLAGKRVVLESGAPPLEGASYWEVAGQLLVRASAGDQSGLFLLDTGATATLLDREFAQRVSGARLSEAARVRAFGGNMSGARYVDGVQVAFGGRKTPPGPLAAVDLAQRSFLSGIEISGFLGLDVWDGVSLVVDTAGQKVRVDEP
ncbi:MAG TPA: aspartyl protease family protein, partial [Candidatus Polarisedimenticolaceae bacterium]|nr:aspartyl protease family protein [Candidatus Polarisedimenticolaceae bacterium]